MEETVKKEEEEDIVCKIDALKVYNLTGSRLSIGPNEPCSFIRISYAPSTRLGETMTYPPRYELTDYEYINTSPDSKFTVLEASHEKWNVFKPKDMSKEDGTFLGVSYYKDHSYELEPFPKEILEKLENGDSIILDEDAGECFNRLSMSTLQEIFGDIKIFVFSIVEHKEGVSSNSDTKYVRKFMKHKSLFFFTDY